MHILLVEDDPLLRRMICEHLSSRNHTIYEADEGHEALALLREHPTIQVVLSDWLMSGMDGLQLCAQIRAREYGHYIYVMLLTARDRQEDVVAGLEGGADDYLTKPFSLKELVARLLIAERISALENSLRQALEELQQQATHDTLTGLLNRQALMAEAQAALAEAQATGKPLALALVDLDHFKHFNDCFGHLVGDRVLCQTASALRGALRGAERLGRWGGEEFLVLMPDTSLAEATARAEQLRRAITARRVETSPGHAETLSASLGVTEASEQGYPSVALLFHSADVALYEAKSAGRDCVRVAQATPLPA